jgi:hypothetical protein
MGISLRQLLDKDSSEDPEVAAALGDAVAVEAFDQWDHDAAAGAEG